jgi:hypothetical protein
VHTPALVQSLKSLPIPTTYSPLEKESSTKISLNPTRGRVPGAGGSRISTPPIGMMRVRSTCSSISAVTALPSGAAAYRLEISKVGSHFPRTVDRQTPIFSLTLSIIPFGSILVFIICEAGELSVFLEGALGLTCALPLSLKNRKDHCTSANHSHYSPLLEIIQTRDGSKYLADKGLPLAIGFHQ